MADTDMQKGGRHVQKGGSLRVPSCDRQPRTGDARQHPSSTPVPVVAFARKTSCTTAQAKSCQSARRLLLQEARRPVRVKILKKKAQKGGSVRSNVLATGRIRPEFVDSSILKRR